MKNQIMSNVYDSLKAFLSKFKLFEPPMLQDKVLYFLTSPKIKTKIEG